MNDTANTENEMNADTFRAAYWTSDDRQAEVCLTAPEHAHLSDDDLMAVAMATAEDSGLDTTTGDIVIGDWTE